MDWKTAKKNQYRGLKEGVRIIAPSQIRERLDYDFDAVQKRFDTSITPANLAKHDSPLTLAEIMSVL